MSVVERITRAAYEKLQRENERLQADLRQERRYREAAEKELWRLQDWTEKIVQPVVGRLADDVAATRAAVERTAVSMSEQLTELESVLGEVQGVITTLTQSVDNESQQLTALLERLNNENPRIDLGPAIAVARNIRDAVQTANTQIQGIVADEPVPEPEPNPEPQPEPVPGQRRR